MLQKQKAERLNRELLATQDLVQQASRQQERTRIARDLHDLVGHHLTALIINLEVAKHQTEGAAREQVEKSHALAKLLLSDVREAISEIRLRDAININGLIELWRSYIPSLDIKTDIDEEIEWHDLTITQTLSFCILEAITNTMRHANANEIVITIEKDGQNILATIRDDGKVSDSITPGNGLTGMCERLQAVGGELKTDIANGQLVLKIKLPAEVQHDH
jgi:signal transduction histidine kinase